MSINQFPPAAAAGGGNDFTVDKNDSTNNVFEMGRAFAAGGYSVTVTGSTAYDIYFLNSAGSSVGYTSGTSVIASEPFDTISALGLGTADVVSFIYNGPNTNAGTAGTETGAAAYLTSISPSDLGVADDTATVTGGNFAAGLELAFISGTVVKPAKNVVVGSSTSAVVTRPDDLINDEEPYDLRAVNPGVTPPTGSNSHILAGTVTAGTDPNFVTASLITGAFPGSAFSTAILTSDSEGTVVNWQVTAGALPSGLSLATATGAISGTPTAEGDYYFTVQITDDGQNTSSQEFNLPVGPIFIESNGASTVVGGTTYLYFTGTGSIEAKNTDSSNIEYLLIAGGGGAGRFGPSTHGGGGGAGGLIHGTAIFSSGNHTVTIGAGGGGGDSGNNGNNSVLSSIATAVGGGRGTYGAEGGNGGSGGGGVPIGTGIPGQGNNGAIGGGGAGAPGSGTNGGNGRLFGAWASAVNIIYDNGYFAGGGGGGQGAVNGGTGGLGGAGDGPPSNLFGTFGSANSGSGGGNGRNVAGRSGGSGLCIVRYS